ncbi:hypothetical protein LDENG_00019880, partial [Lucifuga dentata]
LSHLERKNTYARILFIDFSSAFNTIIPQQLVEKLRLLEVDTGTCNWVLNFLTQRQQTVRVGSHTSDTIALPNDTTVVGLVSNNDESANRMEVKQLTAWCRSHNLVLNVDKTKEMVIDFRRVSKHQHTLLSIDGAAVERVSNVKFLEFI